MNALSHPQVFEQFQSIATTLPGAGLPWLSSLRQAALARFDATGFPTPREEDWKYTNVAPIERKRFVAAAPPIDGTSIDADLLARFRLDDAWTMVIVDGRWIPEYSDLDGVAPELMIAPISRVLETDPDLVERLLGRTVENERHGFIAFNNAFFSDGLLIRVPPGLRLAKPVQLIHLATGSDHSAHLRNLVVLERGAEARLVETFVGDPGSGGLSTAISEVLVEADASLAAYSVQHHPERNYHFGGFYASVGRGAHVHHTNLSLSGLLTRNDIHIALAEGSECELDGLFLGRQRQHVDTHTLIHHRAPHAGSREDYRGILADRSRGVFHGRIIVHPGALQTDARMNNRNLLLSPDAEIDSKPQLEIHADDVKCAHGVAIGQLDEKSVFYLQSRGIDAETARNMLTFAFANAVVDKIDLPSVQNLARQELMTLFPQAGIRRDWL